VVEDIHTSFHRAWGYGEKTTAVETLKRVIDGLFPKYAPEHEFLPEAAAIHFHSTKTGGTCLIQKRG
jgi:hypothetical protein